MKQIMAEAILELGEREKVVLTLYYFEGLTLAEIGEVLGVSEDAQHGITVVLCCNCERVWNLKRNCRRSRRCRGSHPATAAHRRTRSAGAALGRSADDPLRDLEHSRL